MWYTRLTYKDTAPDLFGPCETKEEAEQTARRFADRDGWTAEVFYREEPPQYRDFV